jgi:uncharacterized protein
MSQNSDALKSAYDAFNVGDIETVSKALADDVRWEGPATEGTPMSGVNDGKDAVLQAFGWIAETFESFAVSPDRMVEQGDTIVVLSKVDIKTKSGNALSLLGLEAWQMSDGIAHRVESLIDTAAVKQALGAT